MSEIRPVITLPGSVALSSRQLLSGLRWLVVGAASLLELRAGAPSREMLPGVLVLGVLFVQQTADFAFARRPQAHRLTITLLILDLVGALAATALSGPDASNIFLLYPILLVEATLTFAPTTAYLYTAVMCGLYPAAQILAQPRKLQGWTANTMILALLEDMLFFIVTGVSMNIIGVWQADRKQIDQFSLLDELSLLLADTRQLDDVLERLVELVPQALHVQACAIALDEPGSGRRIWASLGADTSALIDEALLLRGPANRQAEHSHGLMRFPLRDAPYGTIYTLPLAIDERAVGMLTVARVTPDPFDFHDRRLFESLARHAAQALRNARLLRLEAAAASQSRELERFKSEMLASVSHEFRLPLSSITLAAETLLMQRAQVDEGDPEARLLRNIQRSAHRLNGFVQDVLDLARLEANQLELRQQPCDLVMLARTVVRHFEPLCEQKAQRLNLAIPLAEGLVLGDVKRLEQVLSNLLTNAHQYSPEGTEIAVILAPAEDLHVAGPCGPAGPGEAILLGVRDAGPGIVPTERAQIFERFSRGSAGRRRSAGAGLGLHIARSVVELHGGCLWVEGNAAGGSTFWCQLPRAPIPAIGSEVREGGPRDRHLAAEPVGESVPVAQIAEPVLSQIDSPDEAGVLP